MVRMPRRVQHRRVSMTISLPPDLRVRLVEIAASEDRTVSDWVSLTLLRVVADRDAGLERSA